MNNDKFKRLASKISVLLVLNGFAYFLGLLKNILLANYFGASNITDSFFIAFSIPTILSFILGFDLLRGGIFTAVYIKYITRKRYKELSRLIASITLVVLVLNLMIILVSLLNMPGIIRIIAPGFELERLQLAVNLGKIFIFMLLVQSIMYLLIGLLNAYKEFNVPVLGLILYNLIAITFLFAFKNILGIYSITIGILAGLFCAVLINFYKVIRLKCFFSLKDMFKKNTELMKLVPLVLLMIIVISSSQLIRLSEKYIASFYSGGIVSSISYANSIFQMCIILAIQPFLIVFLPYIAESFDAKKIEDAKRLFSVGYRLTLNVVLPIMIIFLLFSKEIICIIFQRGQFSADSTEIAATLLFYYSIGLLAEALNQFYIISYISRKQVKVIFFVVFPLTVFHLIMNFVVTKYIGYIGLPIIFSLTAILKLIFFKVISMKDIFSLSFCKKEIFMLYIKLLAVFVIIILSNRIIGLYFHQIDRIGQILFVIILYPLFCYIFKVKEWLKLFSFLNIKR